VTPITDPTFYLLALPAVVALGLSKGGFAGVGQMATPLLALIMPPLEAAAILLPIMIVQDSVAIWVYRKDWNARVVAIMLPGALIGIGIAWLLAAHISDAAVRLFIGGITAAFCLFNWIGPKRVAAEVERELGIPGRTPNVRGGLFWGTLSGFTSTICQVGSPPYQIYVLPLGLAKMTFVGTTAIFFAAVNWIKVIPYVSLGQFSTTGLTTSLALLPFAILTNALGFWVVRRTPEALFFRITLILMFVISIVLIRSALIELLAA
jgi:uncharacterized membrane protein YfcA